MRMPEHFLAAQKSIGSDFGGLMCFWKTSISHTSYPNLIKILKNDPKSKQTLSPILYGTYRLGKIPPALKKYKEKILVHWFWWTRKHQFSVFSVQKWVNLHVDWTDWPQNLYTRHTQPMCKEKQHGNSQMSTEKILQVPMCEKVEKNCNFLDFVKIAPKNCTNSP